MTNEYNTSENEFGEIEEFLVPGGILTRKMRIQWEGTSASLAIEIPAPTLLDTDNPFDENLLAAARMARLVKNADAQSFAWCGDPDAHLHVWATGNVCGWTLRDKDGSLVRDEEGWEGLVRLFDDDVPPEAMV